MPRKTDIELGLHRVHAKVLVMGSGGFGYTCNIRRPMVIGGKTQPLDPDKPIVMTFYTLVPGPGADAATQGATGNSCCYRRHLPITSGKSASR